MSSILASVHSALSPYILYGVVACLSMSLTLSAATQGLSVLKSDVHGLSLRFVPSLTGFDTVSNNGVLKIQPRYSGLSGTITHKQDEQSFACLRELLAVPGPNLYAIEKCTLHYSERAEKPSNTKDGSQPFQRMVLYSSATSPESLKALIDPWIELEYMGQSGSQCLVQLVVKAERKVEATVMCLESVELSLAFVSNQASSNSSLRHINPGIQLLNANVASQFLLPIVSPSVIAKKSTTNRVLSSSISDGTWVKVSVTDEGLYRIDANALAGLGYSIPASKVASVKVFGNGGLEMPELPSEGMNNQMNEQAIIVHTKQDGSLDEILFYGAGCRGFGFDPGVKRVAHYINHYTETNYYLLTWGGTNGARLKAVEAPTGDVVNTPNQITGRVAVEHELTNAYIAGSGRRWFGEQLDAVVPRTFNTKLPGLIRSGKVSYYIDVAHRTASPAVVTIKENGSTLTTLNLPLTDASEFAYQDFRAILGVANTDAANLASDGSSILQFEYASSDGNSATSGMLDFFEVHYPRQMSAQDDRVSFVSDLNLKGITRYNFSAFSSSNIYGFDVTNPAKPSLLSNQSSTGGIYTFVTKLDSLPSRFYIAASTISPQLSKVEWAGLRDTAMNAELIVICAKELNASAQKFASYRRAHSKMSVCVVNAEDVYNEYGSGIADPSALRDFIQDAVVRWTHKPHYVLLWGDGHFDYKYISTQKKNYVVMWERDDPIPGPYVADIGTNTETYATDDFFACVIGDDRSEDVALGRLPIDSPESGEWMVEKIRHYEESSSQDVWRTTSTFVADDGPRSNNESDGSLHVGQSEQLTNDNSLVPDDVIERKIYLSEYPAENIPKGRLKPGVTADLISMINNHGTLFLNWIGHGNPKVWAHETVLARDITISQFVNLDKLFFMAAESCDFGRCDLVDNQSGSEVMLLSRNGGAIGTFASARVSFSSSNAIIGQELFKQFFTRDSIKQYRTFGDVVLSTKLLHSNDNDRKYFLLGDPTTRILIPNFVVHFDSLNGRPADSSSVASALSTVRVKGRIYDETVKRYVDDFNGSITLSLFDSDILRRFQDPSGLAIGDSTVFQVLKLGGALHRGNYSVTNGAFEAQFVIPKDIAFSNKNGRMFAYAFADDKREAKGLTKSLIIGGILTSVPDDDEGPELGIFMDSHRFLAGDVVRSNPLLILDMADKTGINSTGIGVGHKIEAWIDDNPESVDLSDSYTSSLTDSRKGSAVKQLFNLSPGPHMIRARVWDVLNNVSTVSTTFSVAAADSSVSAARILIYPNPYTSQVTILFTHNQSYSFPVEARIYSSAGQLIRSMDQSVSSAGTGTFVWDATDNDGLTVSQGSYTLILVFHAPNGTVETKAAQIVYMKN